MARFFAVGDIFLYQSEPQTAPGGASLCTLTPDMQRSIHFLGGRPGIAYLVTKNNPTPKAPSASHVPVPLLFWLEGAFGGVGVGVDGAPPKPGRYFEPVPKSFCFGFFTGGGAERAE